MSDGSKDKKPATTSDVLESIPPGNTLILVIGENGKARSGMAVEGFCYSWMLRNAKGGREIVMRPIYSLLPPGVYYFLGVAHFRDQNTGAWDAYLHLMTYLEDSPSSQEAPESDTTKLASKTSAGQPLAVFVSDQCASLLQDSGDYIANLN